MSISGLFLLLAFLFGVATIILWPLLHKQREETSVAPPEIAQLQAEHEAILIAIRDLDFDHQIGKFSQEDYHAQREALVQRGVEIMRRIDERGSALIEEAVRARRTTRKT
jgi:hypothetical protein